METVILTILLILLIPFTFGMARMLLEDDKDFIKESENTPSSIGGG
ncbi:hypothetical protein ACFQ5D_22410 [Paenibacillus farraposensis]|uniref:Uncharacterized protein n=1 Tax=Paenibacillus farraposensis TaxID=2807095 RepID=A0ABW4DL82_9BACL|nr:hypothetical protein [Paenibacillus farraposensis]MCC3378510.1 hypothetical protein [Paenibacillus farraposensis]